MELFVFIFALELSYQPHDRIIRCGQEGFVSKQQDYYSVKFDIEAEIAKYFFVGGFLYVPELFTGGMTFRPFEVGSNIRVGFRWRYIEIGYRHYCFHPVIVAGKIRTPFVDGKVYYEGAHDEVYIRIKGKLK